MKGAFVFLGALLLVQCEINVKHYLSKYGYLTSDSKSPYSEEDIRDAILRYQKTFHLKETGFVDEDTLKLMNTPRCGMKDLGNDFYDNGWSYTNLTYYFYNYTPDLPKETIESLTARALKYWADVCTLKFTKRENDGDIVVAYGARQHYDGRKTCYFPFDGPGGVLAHAFYPPDGRIHFDEDEHFTTKTPEGINYLMVATHELGHILGLQHDMQNQDSIMFPYYRAYDPKGVHLHPNDIRRIRDLYPGAAPVTLPPTKGKTKVPATTMATTVTQRVTKRATPGVTLPSCNDALLGKQCPDHKQYCTGVSKSWTDYMRKYCARTCGYCTGGERPCPPSCKDRHSQCAKYQKRCKGYSENWTVYMRKYCRRTCRYCCLPTI